MSWIGQARKRNQRLGAIAYDGGANVPRRLDLRNSGYLSRMRFTNTLSGQYGTAGPTAQDAFASVGGDLARVTIQANSVGLLYDLSGWYASIVSAIDNAYRLGQTSLQVNSTFVAFGSVGTAAFADKWSFDAPIAIEMDNKPWPLGFFQTALNSQETSVEVRFLPVNAAAGTPGSGIYVPGGGATGPNGTGNLDMQQIYFDPIADQASQPALGFVHQWREFQAPLTADGDTEFRLPPSNYYLRVLYTIVTGGAGALAPDSTHLTRLKLVYGANLAPYDEIPDAVITRNLQDYGFALPAGVYAHDFMHEARNERDIINSAATTDLRAVLNMSGATYSGGAYVKFAVEQLIPLGVPPAGSASVQGSANVPTPA